jgi:hypothetical protein
MSRERCRGGHGYRECPLRASVASTDVTKLKMLTRSGRRILDQPAGVRQIVCCAIIRARSPCGTGTLRVWFATNGGPSDGQDDSCCSIKNQR